ncbi:MAG: pyridoxamine 5'-phosphate oxidase family protein [Chloroflexota bacterium]
MRRKDKEIKDQRLIENVIRASQVVRLGLAKDNLPYVVPLSFGYDGQAIYFHGAGEGRKIDFMQANPQVCFEFEGIVRLIDDASSPCNWSFSFQSVIGYGRVVELTELDDKVAALQCIVRQYSSRELHFEASRVAPVRVWKIEIESLSGKQSKDLQEQDLG